MIKLIKSVKKRMSMLKKGMEPIFRLGMLEDDLDLKKSYSFSFVKSIHEDEFDFLKDLLESMEKCKNGVSMIDDELYSVSRGFGNIESIINKAFKDNVSSLQIVDEVQDKINEIRSIIGDK